MTNEQKLDNAAFGLWLAEGGTDNRTDIDRLKRMLPIALKECCTEKQQLYITHFFVDRMTLREIATRYGVNKSTVSRVIHAGMRNMSDHLRFCSPELYKCAQKHVRLPRNKANRNAKRTRSSEKSTYYGQDR